MSITSEWSIILYFYWQLELRNNILHGAKRANYNLTYQYDTTLHPYGQKYLFKIIFSDLFCFFMNENNKATFTYA